MTTAETATDDETDSAILYQIYDRDCYPGKSGCGQSGSADYQHGISVSQKTDERH